MRPALLVSVVLLAAGLAGCLGGDGTPLDASTAAGMPETAAHAPAVGVHVWGFDATDTYVDLPPREDGSDGGGQDPAPEHPLGDAGGSR